MTLDCVPVDFEKESWHSMQVSSGQHGPPMLTTSSGYLGGRGAKSPQGVIGLAHPQQN